MDNVECLYRLICAELDRALTREEMARVALLLQGSGCRPGSAA